MSDLKSEAAALEEQFTQAITDAESLDALEQVRVAALGKKGRVSELMKGLGKMSPDERKEAGPLLNGLKARITDAITARQDVLHEAALTVKLEQERVDVTLPVATPDAEQGRIHPNSQVIDEIVAIFADMGFDVKEGPDIETDEYNFNALNIPPEHPARQMHDTFTSTNRKTAHACSCARIQAPCRCGPCAPRSRRCASSRRAAPSAATATDAHAHVPPGRRHGDRQGDPYGSPALDA